VPRIFLSYRRDDSAAYTGRIADHLRSHYGVDNVFVDVDTIRVGQDFADALEDSLSKCDAVIAVIGKNWVRPVGGIQSKRLDGDDDWVRLELGTALKRRVEIVPVLVGGASMPRADQLPPDLAFLARRQALEISDIRFHDDVDRLIESLGGTPVAKSHALPPTRFGLPLRARQLTRVIAILGIALVAAAGVVWLAASINRTQPQTPPTSAVGTPADAPRTAPSPTVLPPSFTISEEPTLSTGTVYFASLGPKEERMLSVPGLVRDAQLTLDARCTREGTCLIGAAVSVLDATGAVQSGQGVRFLENARSLRKVKRLVIRPPAALTLKLVNGDLSAVDYWISLSSGPSPAFVPFFGTKSPNPIHEGQLVSGRVSGGDVEFLSIPLKAGAHLATVDYSRYGAGLIVAGLNLLDAFGEYQTRISHVISQARSEHRSASFSVAEDGRYLLRLGGESTLQYSLRVTEGTSGPQD
jgi:hypothetical protein